MGDINIFTVFWQILHVILLIFLAIVVYKLVKRIW
jgi:hypothetical protein